MTNRKLKEAGVNPILGYFLGLVTVILLAIYIFQSTEFAKYLVLLSCLNLVLKLSEKKRTDFLSNAFGEKRKRNIRMIENFLVGIPFLAILLINHAFAEFTLLLILIFLAAIFTFQANFNISMPTPFSKKPFEFTVGFRNTFFIFPIAYALTIIAIVVNNLNLGIFSMLLIFLTTLSYFVKPEDEYFVWVDVDTPKTFLLKKTSLATKNMFFLTTPVLIGLLIYFRTEYFTILIFFSIGLLFLWTIILAKYSAYPREMNLPEGIIIAFSALFPPILLAIMPFFYYKSIDKLKLILNDKN